MKRLIYIVPLLVLSALLKAYGTEGPYKAQESTMGIDDPRFTVNDADGKLMQHCFTLEDCEDVAESLNLAHEERTAKREEPAPEPTEHAPAVVPEVIPLPNVPDGR